MVNEFHDFTDEQLVVLCKKHTNNAYSALVGRYLLSVRSRAACYESSGIDFEDLVQEGFIGLMNAVNNYDVSFGTSFSTFAYLCIDRNIVSAVRKGLSKKQIPKWALVFIDDKNDGEDFQASKTENPESVVISNENIDLLKKKISDNLSELEQNVLEFYLLGYSYEKISENLNLSVKSVDNAVQRIRKKLR